MDATVTSGNQAGAALPLMECCIFIILTGDGRSISILLMKSCSVIWIFLKDLKLMKSYLLFSSFFSPQSSVAMETAACMLLSLPRLDICLELWLKRDRRFLTEGSEHPHRPHVFSFFKYLTFSAFSLSQVHQCCFISFCLGFFPPFFCISGRMQT